LGSVQTDPDGQKARRTIRVCDLEHQLHVHVRKLLPVRTQRRQTGHFDAVISTRPILPDFASVALPRKRGIQQKGMDARDRLDHIAHRVLLGHRQSVPGSIVAWRDHRCRSALQDLEKPNPW